LSPGLSRRRSPVQVRSLALSRPAGHAPAVEFGGDWLSLRPPGPILHGWERDHCPAVRPCGPC